MKSKLFLIILLSINFYKIYSTHISKIENNNEISYSCIKSDSTFSVENIAAYNKKRRTYSGYCIFSEYDGKQVMQEHSAEMAEKLFLKFKQIFNNENNK